MFLIAFVKVSRKMLTGDSASFCVKARHTNKNHSDMSKTSPCCLCVCLVKVAELWEWLTWLRGRS